LPHQKNWQYVSSPEEAQAEADRGKLVILAYKNPTGGHGHVATVRPSEAGDKQGSSTGHGPLIANVGPKKYTGVVRRSAAVGNSKKVIYYVMN
jgi:hypothetical protein